MRRYLLWLESLFRPREARSPSAADADAGELDLDDPYPEPIALEIEDVFDLHTLRPRDVRRAVAAYLIEAHRAGFRSVRIIHGKGIGVQRRAVREVLAATPFVREVVDRRSASSRRTRRDHCAFARRSHFSTPLRCSILANDFGFA
ncbi:MAG: Smr/MutS family protein [Pyrinomonadaceae bacterium]